MWKFTSKGDKILIENINETKVWGTTSDGKLILESFEDNKENINKTNVWGTTSNSKVIPENFQGNKAGQLWKKGGPNNKGYFTLENDRVSKFLTAVSSTSLELKGNSNMDTNY